MVEYRIERKETEVSMEDYLAGNHVDVPTFLECCKECPNYGQVWSCPPYDFDQLSYWKEFKTFHIVGNVIHYPEGTTLEEAGEVLLKVKNEMQKEFYAMEEQYEGSRCLFAGNCNLCGMGNCTRAKGEPCRFPDKMRFSIESIGGNVGKTIDDYLGIDICWSEEGKVPEHFVLVGGLLKK